MPNPVAWLADYPHLLPFLIFGMRICDVSLDTIRMICIVRGLRLFAALFGFVAVFIWLIAISTVMQHLTNPLNMIAYAGGYAAGNWVGIWLEGRLALGQQVVRLISFKLDGQLAEGLRKMGFVVTEIEGRGRNAPVKICFVATRRREVSGLMEFATRMDPDIFITVEDTRATNRPLARYIPGRLSSPPVIRSK